MALGPTILIEGRRNTASGSYQPEQLPELLGLLQAAQYYAEQVDHLRDLLCIERVSVKTEHKGGDKHFCMSAQATQPFSATPLSLGEARITNPSDSMDWPAHLAHALVSSTIQAIELELTASGKRNRTLTGAYERLKRLR